MLKVILIFLGSGIGGLLRYALAGLVQNWWGPSFPAGTLVVNLSGCLAIGFLASLMTGPILVREEFRVAILVGVLGGYTTFSTFGRETMSLVGDGEWFLAFVNIVLSNGLGLAAVWAGTAISVKMYGAGGP